MPYYENRRRQEKQARVAEWKASPPAKVDAALAAELQSKLQGDVAVPESDIYQKDEKTRWNHAFPDAPALIAFCEVPADVRACLSFARKHAMRFCCRSGGHSTTGYSLVNDGLVIDVSRIHDVYVDAGKRQAIVGAGTSFHKLNAVLDGFGLHVPGGGCPDVCVGGYMQGGGYGFTSRMFGINSDNVLQVRVMLHDGSIVVANAVENQDLYWAVRGGTGNNFGVLLSVTYQLHPLREVWGFSVKWEIERAAEALSHLQQTYMKTNASRRIGWQGMLVYQDGKPVFLARGMYNGSKEEGLAAIADMRKVGDPELQYEGSGSYLVWNEKLLTGIPQMDLVQNGFPYKEDKFSAYVARPLPAEEWQEVVDYYRTTKQPGNSIGMEIYGGVINDYPWSDSAFIHRDVHMDFFVDSFWFEPKNEERAKDWLLSFREIVDRYWNGHSYQNYPRRHDKNYRWMYWGEAYNSLLFVKNKYDPESFFDMPQGISPYPDDPSIRRATQPSKFKGAAIEYENPEAAR